MYLAGFLAGLASAILSSLAYVASKSFINRFGSPVKLTLLSYVFMMIPSLLVLILLWGKYELSFGTENVLNLTIAGASAILAQVALFFGLRYVEASRFSSLLGLKIISLSLVCVLLLGEDLTLLQWGGVILSTIAAMGINYSGLRLPFLAVICLAGVLSLGVSCDLFQVRYIQGNSGDSVLIQSMASVAFLYLCMGAVMIPTLFFFKWDFRAFFGTAPYGAAWFCAMLTLFYSFSEVGLVCGSVLQATRGIFSVIIGAIILYAGVKGHEAPVSRRDWIRRFIMSALMVCAVAMYSLGKH